MPATTACVTLREWDITDLPSLVRNAGNPRVAATMRDLFPSPYSEDDGRRFLAMAAARPSRNIFRAILVGDDVAGGIRIHPLEDVHRRTAEIGYWLAEPFWGRGVMTEAVRLILPLAFADSEILRIQAGIFESNPASMRVLEKNGFTREAVHHNAITKNGVVMDEVMYARLRKNGGDQTGSTRLP